MRWRPEDSLRLLALGCGMCAHCGGPARPAEYEAVPGLGVVALTRCTYIAVHCYMCARGLRLAGEYVADYFDVRGERNESER